MIYFAEVKGTNKLKAADYYKIQEMNWKGSKYKQVRIGIMYFSSMNADQNIIVQKNYLKCGKTLDLKLNIILN